MRSAFFKTHRSNSLLFLVNQFPMVVKGIKTQEISDLNEARLNTIEYNRPTLKNIPREFESKANSKASELKIEELPMIEENISRNLDTHWTWK
jgi:hypothetical protein